MPRYAKEQVSGSNLNAPAPAAVRTQLTAHTVDLGKPSGAIPTDNRGFELAAALKSWVDPVAAHVERKAAEAAKEEAERAKQLGMERGLGTVPGEADNRPIPPEAINAAYGPAYARGLGMGVAGKITADYSVEYENTKNTPGFDLNQFIQKVDKEFAGAKDPAMQDVFNQTKARLYGRFRDDYADVRLKQLREGTDNALNDSLGLLLTHSDTESFNDWVADDGHIQNEQEMADLRAVGKAAVEAGSTPSADGTPLLEEVTVVGKAPSTMEPVGPAVHRKWTIFKELAGNLQRTTPEAAEKFLQNLETTSVKLNGRPDLFDFAYIKDDSGMSLVNSNPKIADKILQLQSTATKQRQNFITNGAKRSNAETLIDLNTAVEQGDFAKVTDEKLFNHFGQAGVFNTPEEIAGFITKRNKAMRDSVDLVAAAQTYQKGLGAFLAPDVQEKILNQLGAPVLDKLVNATNDQERGAAISGLVAIHERGGMQPHKGVKAWLSGADRIDPANPKSADQFLFKAKAYKSLKDTAGPAMATAYTSDASREMYEEYWLNRSDYGQDDKLALQNAALMQDPKVVAERKALVNDPDFKKGTAKAVAGVLSDINPNWIQRVLKVPFTSIELTRGKAENTAFLQHQMEGAVSQYRIHHPDAAQDQIAKWSESWIQSHVAYEKQTNSFVRLSPEENNKETTDAMGWMVDKIKASNEPFKGSVMFWTPVGDKLQLQSMFPSQTLSPPMSPSEIRRSHYGATSFTPAEAIEMKGLVQAARAGTATREMVTPYADLLKKANIHGLVPKSDLDLLNSNVDTPAYMPKATFSPPPIVQDTPTASPKALQSKSRNMTRTMVEQAMANDDPVFALVAAGETYMDTVHADPNPTVGANIGFGYNIMAAQKGGYYVKDMRQAGVAVDQLKLIEAGRVSLSPDQVTRLAKIAIGRATDEAQKDFDGLVKNMVDKEPSKYRLFNQLTKREQAYLVDVTYQSGTLTKLRDSGKLDFASGVWAMSEGRHDDVKKSFVLHYNDGNGMVQDKRRNGLRNSMLDGINLFKVNTQHELAN